MTHLYGKTLFKNVIYEHKFKSNKFKIAITKSNRYWREFIVTYRDDKLRLWSSGKIRVSRELINDCDSIDDLLCDMTLARIKDAE